MLVEVKNQYEDYPYPPRNPDDERTRLINTGVDNLEIVNHYCFEGKAKLDNFRVLVAGGGTGDALIFLAEQLKDTKSELVYIDLSEASMQIAKKRAEIRGLTNITFINGSLLSLQSYNLGKFDYINCSGVLHHLESPEAGLAALKAVLKPTGAMAIMVYGKYGRTGIYELQQLLRMINKDVSDPRQKIVNAKQLLHTLPDTSWFKRNYDNFKTEIDLYGDAGIYDLLLHSQDRAYIIGEIYDLIEGQGLKLLSFVEPTGFRDYHYNPLTYSNSEELKALSARQKHEAAEIMFGQFKKHTFYAGFNTRTVASIDNLESIPYFSSFDIPDGFNRKIIEYFRDNDQPLEMKYKSATIKLAKQRHIADILMLIDGKNSIKRIIDAISGDKQEISREFAVIYDCFNSLNLMLLR